MVVDDLAEADEAEEEEDEELAIAEPDADASLDEIVAKTEVADPEEEEESVLDMGREERLESLSIRAVPKQSNEFICTSCHLVKHQSQLANKKRELCRDCV